jgi:hypothetical protein
MATGVAGVTQTTKTKNRKQKPHTYDPSYLGSVFVLKNKEQVQTKALGVWLKC